MEIASRALSMAVDKSNSLDIPLVIAGDLHDTKANLRGECIKAIIGCLSKCVITPYVIVGNHDKINEKSKDHSLEFLRQMSAIVDTPTDFNPYVKLLPYYSDAQELKQYLKTSVNAGTIVIMHQGLTGSAFGEYIQDKSAITHDDVADFRVISGHYHTRQDIQTGRPKKDQIGMFSYIGNPYTLNFGEVKDPAKGFQILNSDGSLEFIPTNLRQHVVMDLTVEELKSEAIFLGDDADLLWVKIRGTTDELKCLSKKSVALDLDITQPFKLDLVPTETKVSKDSEFKNQSQEQILDTMIDSLSNTEYSKKEKLKAMWKSFIGAK